MILSFERSKGPRAHEKPDRHNRENEVGNKPRMLKGKAKRADKRILKLPCTTSRTKQKLPQKPPDRLHNPQKEKQKITSKIHLEEKRQPPRAKSGNKEGNKKAGNPRGGEGGKFPGI